jgi:hypothetical protein
MTRFDWCCVAWVFGLAFSMVIFAMPTWDERKIEVVKVKVQPVLIEGPREVRR